MNRALLLAFVGMLASAPPTALAQVCPPGYYYASDGNCYSGVPPSYPPPVYDPAPPVSAPPVVADGLMIGLGLLLGAAIFSDRDEHREVRRGPPRREERREPERRERERR